MSTPAIATVPGVVPIVEVGIGDTRTPGPTDGRWDSAHWGGALPWRDVLLEPFNTLASWGGVTLTTIVGGGRTGSAAQTTAAGSVAVYGIPAASESEWVTVGFAFNATGNPADRLVMQFRSDAGATTHVRLVISPAGVILAYRGTVTLLGSSAASGWVTAGTWAYIEVQVRLHDTAGSVVVRVNGTQALSLTNVDTRNAGTKAVIDSVALSGSNSITQLYDDMYVTVGAGAPFKGSITIPPATLNDGTVASDYWAGSEPGWLDITCDVRSVATHVGHDRTLDAWDVGTCTVTLANPDGWADITLDPLDPAQLSLRPGRAIRWGILDLTTGALTYRFRGFIDAMHSEYAGPQVLSDSVTLECVDALGEVGRVRLTKVTPPAWDGETVADRLNRTLDAVGWRSEWRDIAPNTTPLMATDMDRLASDELSAASDSSGGALFGDYQGRVSYRGRDWQTWLPGAPPDLVLGNVAPATVCPSVIDVSFPRAGTTTRALVNYDGAEVAPVQRDDVIGQVLYGVETTPERLDLMTTDPTQLASLAVRLIETRGAATMPRVQSLTLDAGRDRPTMLAMLSADPQRPTRWQLLVDRAGRPLLDRMLLVTAVEHQWDAHGWQCAVTLDDAMPWAAAGGRWDGAAWDGAAWAEGTSLLARLETLSDVLGAA